MKYFLYFSAIIVTLSCTRPPELDNVPKISFENIAFREVPNGPDELILDIYFEDGDGDLGLRPEETFPPYSQRLFVTDQFGELYTYPATDTFPDYNNNDWFIRKENVGSSVVNKDTIYAPINPNHYNIFINFYVMENGKEVLIDFQEEFNIAGGYNGRFPILFDEPANDRALEGSLRYRMKSAGWLNIFSIKEIKLEIQIQDRALNKSNIIFTDTFTLPEIQVN